MKRLIFLVLTAIMAAAPRVQAFDEDALVGAAMGAGLGWVVARHAHGIRPEIAIPVGALTGAWVGHELRHERRAYHARRYDEWSGPWYGTFWPTVHACEPRYYVQERYVVVPPERPVVRAPAYSPSVPPPSVANPQPGVGLVKVQVRNRNGLYLDVAILRLGDRFIGPQGEEYATLPTAEQLQKQYGF